MSGIVNRIIRAILYLTILSLIFVASKNLYAHNKTVKGRVLIKNGSEEPVIGASVSLEGTVLGAITDKKGNFIIKRIPDGKYTLLITSVGMETIRKDISLEHIEGDELLMNFEMIENPIKVSTVVVTATRSEKIYDDVPIRVSTISASDIKATSSTNLRESLQFQPGVRTEVNCQNCGFSQVRINGMDGKYSQILIDGKPIFSSLNGVYGLDQIPANMIDRIEVIRGGGSALYGGNAVAGVINVITKDPCINSFNIGWDNMLIKGKYPENVTTVNASIMNEDQNLGLSVSGMLNNRHEYDANSDGYSEIGRMEVKTFGSKLFWRSSSRSRLIAEINSIQHSIRGGNKLELLPHETDVTESAEHSTLIGQIAFEQFTSSGNKFNIFISGQNTKRNSYYGANQDINAYGTTDNQTFAAGFHYSHIVDDLLGNHIFTAGYDYNYDEMQDYALAYDRVIDQKVSSHGIFLQDEWVLSDIITLLIGARMDNNNKIDNLIFNPRASILFQPIKNLIFRTTYSTGYRAPQAFDEDLHITQVGGEGIIIRVDDDLKPEYSRSISASLDYSTFFYNLPIAFSLEYFSTKLSDAFILEDIGSDENSSRILMRYNGESADFNGVTFEVQSKIREIFSLKLGLTYQKSIYSSEVEWSAGDDEEGVAPQFSDKVLKTPDLYGYIIASYKPINNLFLDVSAYHTGSMYIAHYAGYVERDIMKKTESFLDLNAKLTYKLFNTPGIELSFAVLNILNSYQKDFDKSSERDAGYMYGPFRPITTSIGIRIIY